MNNESCSLYNFDFEGYLEHLKSLGCEIEDYSYCHTDKTWSVKFRFIPTKTPEWIDIKNINL
jgi:hypothetical protein